uniref:Ras association domain family member 6 n=1 Tax=Neogobius melanostomus TaxID=47308 RepID=A0A8C6US67_9GOBI
MSESTLQSVIHTGDGRTLTRSEFLSLINTYNWFLKDQTQLHLTYSQDRDGEVTVEGFLNISWGVTMPIRLQIQDDKQTPPSPLITPEISIPISPLESKRGMTRWGEYSDLHQIDENAETPDILISNVPPALIPYETTTLRPMRHKNPEQLEAESNLFRCQSDASLVKMRRKAKTAVQREKERQHRFSINGHFYNYKTSIFTPTHGASTKVRITSRMSTHQVIEQLLHKFKIENDPEEFALYCVHQSGEKRKLCNRDQPLWERILCPSEDIVKIFLMDREEEEVSNDVAQYLNLELPILEQVLLKLRDEESKEIQRVISKYHHQHRLLSNVLNCKVSPHTETSV